MPVRRLDTAAWDARQDLLQNSKDGTVLTDDLIGDDEEEYDVPGKSDT
jgi:hypothetical protein